MGYKGLGYGSTGDGVHHRRLDFNESSGIERPAQRLHQLAALNKHFPHFGIHEQIDISLPVPLLDIGKSVPLFRQGQKIFGEKCDVFHVNRQLPGTRTEEIPADTDVIAQIEQLVEFECVVADGIFLDVNLQPLAILLQVGKAGFSHQADRHDPAGDTNRDSRSFQFLPGFRGVFAQNLRNRVGKVVAARIGLLAKSLNLLQFVAPQLVNFVVECQGVPSGARGKQ